MASQEEGPTHRVHRSLDIEWAAGGRGRRIASPSNHLQEEARLHCAGFFVFLGQLDCRTLTRRVPVLFCRGRQQPIPEILPDFSGLASSLELLGEPDNRMNGQYAIRRAGKICCCGYRNDIEIDVLHHRCAVNQVNPNHSSPWISPNMDRTVPVLNSIASQPATGGRPMDRHDSAWALRSKAVLKRNRRESRSGEGRLRQT